eukprot:5659478-Amphidinium_carterae.1
MSLLHCVEWFVQQLRFACRTSMPCLDTSVYHGNVHFSTLVRSYVLPGPSVPKGAKEEEEAPQDSPAPSVSAAVVNIHFEASKESTQEPLDAQQTSEGKNIQAMPEPKAGLVQQEPKVELAAAPGHQCRQMVFQRATKTV